MLRSSPSHGPGSLVVPEPSPQHLPTLSATSSLISLAAHLPTAAPSRIRLDLHTRQATYVGGCRSGRPLVHGAVAGREDDEVRVELRAVIELHAVLFEAFDLEALAGAELDLAIDEQLHRADIDVVAGAAAQVLHEQAGVVVAPVVHEAHLLQALVEVGIALTDLRACTASGVSNGRAGSSAVLQEKSSRQQAVVLTCA